MKRVNILALMLAIVMLGATCFFALNKKDITRSVSEPSTWWQIQSIDTVKSSRDVASEKRDDDSFDLTISLQVKKVAGEGVTHIAIGTPYDPEFTSFLRKWVKAVRNQDLKVWFRGNLSGWEGWFGYPSIDYKTHSDQIEQFILINRDLFEDGDLFDPCPECENGNWGDPRSGVDLREYRQFLVNEHDRCIKAFSLIGKNVKVVHSMNGDVALLVMDQDTTKKLGGTVTIDHYVGSSDELTSDIDRLAESSEGNILLGEYGAPITDIHGDISESQQANLINESLDALSKNGNVIGVNYWTSFGGSTSLWREDGVAKEAALIVGNYYSPKNIKSEVIDELGKPVSGAEVSVRNKKYFTGKDGEVTVQYIQDGDRVTIEKKGYNSKNITVSKSKDISRIVLIRKDQGSIYVVLKKIYKILSI